MRRVRLRRDAREEFFIAIFRNFGMAVVDRSFEQNIRAAGWRQRCHTPPVRLVRSPSGFGSPAPPGG
jgi:hypothetical protein